MDIGLYYVGSCACILDDEVLEQNLTKESKEKNESFIGIEGFISADNFEKVSTGGSHEGRVRQRQD